jgi:hypothetical protein
MEVMTNKAVRGSENPVPADGSANVQNEKAKLAQSATALVHLLRRHSL